MLINIRFASSENVKFIVKVNELYNHDLGMNF